LDIHHSKKIDRYSTRSSHSSIIQLTFIANKKTTSGLALFSGTVICGAYAGANAQEQHVVHGRLIGRQTIGELP
jgi:hypothetical protein